jgi:ubiquinone/menaquinone biosynthesis C-methylase UbiE
VGRLARHRLGPDAPIAGVDASPAMLTIARRADSTIDWRAGNAMALPVPPDEHFSMVTCHQGLQFFPDKVQAVREMRRVLAPGGRVAIATWRSIADLPFATDLHAVAERHLGPVIDVRHSFGDPDAFPPLLAAGGFSDVRVETLSEIVRGIDAPTYARLNAMAIVGMSADAKARSDDRRAELIDRVAADSLGVLERYTLDGVFQFTLAANLATARAA